VYVSTITLLLTPWCIALLQKLTGLQLVKKFPAFYGTRRFITALTSLRHPSLSWASSIQSIYPHPTSWRSILILSTHLCLGLPVVSFPPVSPPRPYTPPLLTHTRHNHFITQGNYKATCFDYRLVILGPIFVNCVTRCCAHFGIPSCLHPWNTSN